MSSLWPLFNLTLIVFIIFLVYYVVLVFTNVFFNHIKSTMNVLKK
ncbi:Uncharacterised protein [Sphingobacterium spiritivorum]|uniref:Uncharacterized protein n=1 Tax=Sphingobacterium spiritivorum TaxID=258 RepID=A0A380CU89_SPHSI|nr:Uncharacterised protein [Sphingobacterium spiritivorum]